MGCRVLFAVEKVSSRVVGQFSVGKVFTMRYTVQHNKKNLAKCLMVYGKRS